MTNGRSESFASEIKQTIKKLIAILQELNERRGRESEHNIQLHATIIKIHSVNQIEFQCANYHWLNLSRETYKCESE